MFTTQEEKRNPKPTSEKTPSWNFTGFNRYPQLFAKIPKLLDDEQFKEGRISICSGPCASGLEIYSIMQHVMRNMSREELLERVKFFGYDINPTYVSTAKKGTYVGKILQDRMRIIDDAISESVAGYDQRLCAFENIFTIDRKQNGLAKLVVQEPLQEICTFETRDLRKLGATNQFDLFTAMWLFPHYDNPDREILVEQIAQAIRPGGFLMTDSAAKRFDNKQSGWEQQGLKQFSKTNGYFIYRKSM